MSYIPTTVLEQLSDDQIAYALAYRAVEACDLTTEQAGDALETVIGDVERLVDDLYTDRVLPAARRAAPPAAHHLSYAE